MVEQQDPSAEPMLAAFKKKIEISFLQPPNPSLSPPPQPPTYPSLPPLPLATSFPLRPPSLTSTLQVTSKPEKAVTFVVPGALPQPASRSTAHPKPCGSLQSRVFIGGLQVSHPSENQMSPAAAQLSEFASMSSINPFLLSISRPLFSPRRRWSGGEIWVDGTNECGCGNRSVKKKKYKEGTGSWKDFGNSWVTKYPRRTCVLIPVPSKMCIVCGLPVNEKLFGYKNEGLMLKNEEIERVNKLGIKKLLRHNKLYLVVDLDHTLLYFTDLNQMTAGEDYLQSQTDAVQDVSKVDIMNMMTKLRPFVKTFLKEANEMYEMYLYTTGERAYALEMAKLLDPRKEYFGDRVIMMVIKTLKAEVLKGQTRIGFKDFRFRCLLCVEAD
ncbi:hypothetical protein TB2_007976 [Malus domestica]